VPLRAYVDPSGGHACYVFRCTLVQPHPPRHAGPTARVYVTRELRAQGGEEWDIRRRFSDFLALHTRLARHLQQHPHCVPPPKVYLGSTSQATIETRKPALAQYVKELLRLFPLDCADGEHLEPIPDDISVTGSVLERASGANTSPARILAAFLQVPAIRL